MIRERISTATLLLIARTAQNLRQLYVRRNQLVEECEWPQNPDWTDEFFQWLQSASQTIESTEKEISQILQTDWKSLSDENFQKTSLIKHVDY